jgi:hypothetical protein
MCDKTNTNGVNISSNCKIYSRISELLLTAPPRITGKTACELIKNTIGEIVIHRKKTRKSRSKRMRKKDRKNIYLVETSAGSLEVKSEGRITSLHLRLMLGYLLSHNGTVSLNESCENEDCKLKQVGICKKEDAVK